MASLAAWRQTGSLAEVVAPLARVAQDARGGPLALGVSLLRGSGRSCGGTVSGSVGGAQSPRWRGPAGGNGSHRSSVHGAYQLRSNQMFMQELQIWNAQTKVWVLSKALAHGLLVRENIRERVALINFAEAVICERLKIIPHVPIKRRVLCSAAAHHELRDGDAGSV